jgi:hypothetical protein
MDDAWFFVLVALVGAAIASCSYIVGKNHGWLRGWEDARRTIQGEDDDDRPGP